MLTLPAPEWREREAAHQARADAFSAGWRARQQSGEKHPVDDFLFTYYPFRPSLLRRWHPGAGVVLEGAGLDKLDPLGGAGLDKLDPLSALDPLSGAGLDKLDPLSGLDPLGTLSTHDWRASYKWYRREGEGLVVDDAAFRAARGASIRFIVGLLSATAARPGQFACFGLHEWAMVYRATDTAEANPYRHDLPLRLGQGGTDEVVEQSRITCSHIDAFRFFTPAAAPLNELTPTRENQPQLEQPGCLHAGMDVYKWATKLGPLIAGELLLDCFELARDIRELDMRASPYDLGSGYTPVRIETTEGRAEYAREQRGFASRSNALRARVVAAVGLV